MYSSNSPYYILLPQNGVKAKSNLERQLMTSLPSVKSSAPPIHSMLEFGLNEDVLIRDAVSEDGPKLVQINPSTADKINASSSPIRAVELITYKHPRSTVDILAHDAGQAAGDLNDVTITIRNAQTGIGVHGVKVVAFTDFAAQSGDKGITDASGKVNLRLKGGNIERLYGLAPYTYWGAFRRNIVIQKDIDISIEPINLSIPDCVRTYYPNTQFDEQMGVTVGVIDTGIWAHANLNIIGGENTVTGENENDFSDWDSHGTHVAGLIGAFGNPPNSLRGMAPNVRLNAYRVFGEKSNSATNYAILKAMILAEKDECDIVNLSLGGGPFDKIVQEAIMAAVNRGMVVIVAAGNDGQGSVDYPAAYEGAIGVSAMGIQNTFPTGSLEEGDILFPPNGNNSQEFFAAFSNFGYGIDVIGLGVGTLSTLPGNQFGPMSGTSMAAPVVAGAAACLLSNNPQIYNMPRTRNRSERIKEMIQMNCIKRGFGAKYEGYGLPDPQSI